MFSIISGQLLANGPVVIAAGVPLSIVGRTTSLSSHHVFSHVLRIYIPVVFSKNDFHGDATTGGLGETTCLLN